MFSTRRPSTAINTLLSVAYSLALIGWADATSAQSIRSPNGKFEARAVPSSDPKDVHYEVKEVPSGRVIVTTFAQFKTPNDVKAGAFSEDSKRFAAAYHYGHDGTYTWIGVWNLETGKLQGDPLRSKGFTTDVGAALKSRP
ncbi:MAG: hypothetical protein V5B40_15555 [Candidatus Accumulibacter meliphilus]|jgi:hypothetical protein|uniref:hypothetical protein n=1 Tax=Candidatus Accumulibacter meliphilus TaxID=2211374 RepID=UPI002FC35FDA